ncbi:MAG: FAD-dependent oxidoreductase [Oscillospiraceae bacterium]|nr:FAD-dependent oxidoreductase [Oscillospiraceae bacterium]
MDSVWSKIVNTENVQPHPCLEGNQKTGTLIVGGGMAGVLCAHFLHHAGADYMLAEADRIGMGITKNTTAKITAQHGLIYDKLIRQASFEKAQMYLSANLHAVDEFKKMCSDMNIDCRFEEQQSYVYSIDDAAKIEKEIAALQKLGYTAEFADTHMLPFKTAGAVRFNSQAQFHPLKFIEAVSAPLNIYENTFVSRIDRTRGGYTAITQHGIISAENITIATHFPVINIRGLYFLKMYQHRSYVIALESASHIDGMYVDEKETGMSFRQFGNLLFVGGGDHRTGKKGGAYDELRAFAAKYYPEASEKYAWATQDCMTLDGVPYIGQLAKSMPNLYIATGFNKWGMTSSMVSAMILSDMTAGKRNEYSDVFRPDRSILKPQLLKNGGEALLNLLTPSTKRCAHMGCALNWNKVEKTWDCPCHGSRFDEHGHVIDNPAGKKIKIGK